MAGTIVADTLTHSTAGSLTTDYVVNGSAKAHFNYDQTGTPAIGESLNVSSISDNSTGNFTANWSNSMSQTDYSGAGITRNKHLQFDANLSASSAQFASETGANARSDQVDNLAVVFGGLA